MYVKDINLQDSNGWTPVHSASYHGVIKDKFNY
jgi:ankyrin repeat protein